jgi:putative tricarboxylic transport membrane protein
VNATTEQAPSEPAHIDKAQYGLAAVLAVVGIYTIIDARGLNIGFGDPIGPRVFPYLIGAAMVILAVLLAVATARGDVGEGEGGEDVDLTTAPDWLTIGKLLGVLVLNLLFVNIIGWAITGGLLFAGCAWALGSTALIRDLLAGFTMSIATWYFFYLLDVELPPGILDGIL